MKNLKQFDPIITDSDRELCTEILKLIDSPDSESRILGRSLFKTTDLYRKNFPGTLWVGCHNVFGGEHKVNLTYLLSDKYTFEIGNLYFYYVRDMIECLSSNKSINFYHYAN